MFDFLKDKTADKSKREFSLIEVACLLIHASKIDQNYTEKEKTIKQIKKDPRNFIAQPLALLSTSPTFDRGMIEPRHLDLRPFILSGSNTYVTVGGLTRVALKKGSTVVNSSQGGGSKDTWIVDK